MNSNKIAFGSCNKQTKPQSHWKAIAAFQPSHFIWSGDAVYSKGNDLQRLENAFQNLTSSTEYSNFRERVIIDGAWDDHDYGVNDGGKFIKNKKERQKLYTDFISSPSNDLTKLLGQQEGLHHSLLDVEVSGLKVKFIFLDTRTFRENHFIPSLSQSHAPFSAYAASGLRGLYSVMGFGREYSGEVLGDQQWDWLENTLSTSSADMHVIVSSIQVMTTDPVMESWGHFPVEKRKLFSVLQKHDPKGTLFISGDVHIGEIARTEFKREDNSKGEWIEVTSSGLTHHAGDNKITAFLAPILLKTFNSHRIDKDSFYLGRNFGLIEVNDVPEQGGSSGNESDSSGDRLEGQGWNVEVSVRSLEHQSESAEAPKVFAYNLALPKTHQKVTHSPIRSVDIPDFPVLPAPLQAVVYCLILFALYVLRWLLQRCGKSTNRKDKKRRD